MTKRNETELLAAFVHMAEELGGTFKQVSTYDQTGRTSKKLTIEYNVQEKQK